MKFNRTSWLFLKLSNQKTLKTFFEKFGHATLTQLYQNCMKLFLINHYHYLLPYHHTSKILLEDQENCHKILLILNWMISDFQMLQEKLKNIYQLMLILILWHILVNLITLALHCYVKSSYTTIILNQKLIFVI